MIGSGRYVSSSVSYVTGLGRNVFGSGRYVSGSGSLFTAKIAFYIILNSQVKSK